MSKPSTPPPVGEKKKLNTRFHDDMPPSFQAAGRIIQILSALSLTDAEKALGVVNELFKDRGQLADKPPHVPE